MFLGIRPEESLRLHWDHFDFEARELTIPPEIAKGGEGNARIDQIPPKAMAWLARFLPHPIRSKGGFKDLPPKTNS